MRWAVLVGGTGSNLRAIVESGLSVELVISHRADAGALAIAEAHRIPTRVVLAKDYPDRDAYDAALRDCLAEYNIERIAMAGFLRWLTSSTIAQYGGAILNLHPSLLPAYPGLHAIERAYRDGVLWTGVTVHFVDEGHDSGPIVAQVPVPRLPRDSIEDLASRVHAAEHQLYPEVLKAVDRGKVRLIESRVTYVEEDEQWMYGRLSASMTKADSSR